MTLSIKSRLTERGPGTRKLDEAKVLAIRSMLADAVPQKDIAMKFNVSRSAITDIKTGKTWWWVQ